MNWTVRPGGSLSGKLRVPGDKSISHRSVMLGSLADGTTRVSGFLDGEDCLATMRSFEAMGVSIQRSDATSLTIDGVGIHGLRPPGRALYLGNSGTSMRLMSGLLAAQSFPSVLTGDESLSRRPMRRVIDPLSRMGARIESEQGLAPLKIHPADRLQAISHRSKIASAQVKSCVLLAGLYAEGETEVLEPETSRDHTERMLRAFGVEVSTAQGRAAVRGGQSLKATEIKVPADISSAAFFLVGAAISEGSDVLLQAVGLNPARDGVIHILRDMGADIELLDPRRFGGEPVADIRVRGRGLKGIAVDPARVGSAIDEFPALFVAAACAEGETIVTGAEELRVKESDRIQSMVDGLVCLGGQAEATPDGAIIRGAPLSGGTVDSHGDHRVAMAFAMAALRSSGDIQIQDCANVDTSFPGFAALAAGAGLRIG